MHVVGIRELKNRLSEYLRLVRSGEVVWVTDRGRVVAEIRRPDAVPTNAELGPGLLALAKRGILSLGARNRADIYPRLRPLVPEGAAAALLDEERGER